MSFDQLDLLPAELEQLAAEVVNAQALDGADSFDFRRRVVLGTPITPKHLLHTLAGSSFCVSFAAPEQLNDCVELVGAEEVLVLDNGAFSIWRAGKEGRALPKRLQFASQAEYREAFWQWANAVQARCPQAVAVIPDVIEGSEHDNLCECSYAVRNGFAEFPERVMAIWHLNDSLEQLEKFARLFNFVGFGSCAEYDVQRNKKGYFARIKEASDVLDRVEREHNRRPWVHLMRGLGVFSKLTRFESADSCNVAINHSRHKKAHGDKRAQVMADRIKGEVLAGASSARIEPVTSSITNFYNPPTLRPAL